MTRMSARALKLCPHGDLVRPAADRDRPRTPVIRDGGLSKGRAEVNKLLPLQIRPFTS